MFLQHTVPQEFNPIAPISIGLTAGYEADKVHPGWINSVNRMTATIVSSKFAKQGFLSSVYKLQNGGTLAVDKQDRIEVVTEGIDVDRYGKPGGSTLRARVAESVREPFVFLASGMWLQGQFGHDRKDIGRTVKLFVETFRGRKDVALILKTQMITPSESDRSEVVRRLESLVGDIKSPRVYLIHGELTDEEMIDLNHLKNVKAMISLTHGEGFGRPLAEFALTGKPIVTTSFGGQTDFLSRKLTPFVKSELRNIHPSAHAEGMTPPGGQWGYATDVSVHSTLHDVVENYDMWRAKAMQMKAHIAQNFSFEAMKDQLAKVLDKYAPADDLDIPVAKEVTQ